MVLGRGSLGLIGTAVGAIITLRLLSVAARAASPNRFVSVRALPGRPLVSNPSTARRIRRLSRSRLI